jgi:hypothetical protein
MIIHILPFQGIRDNSLEKSYPAATNERDFTALAGGDRNNGYGVLSNLGLTGYL